MKKMWHRNQVPKVPILHSPIRIIENNLHSNIRHLGEPKNRLCLEDEVSMALRNVGHNPEVHEICL
jgi:hypothetical protein